MVESHIIYVWFFMTLFIDLCLKVFLIHNDITYGGAKHAKRSKLLTVGLLLNIVVSALFLTYLNF